MSLALSPALPDAPGLRVNQRELARLLGVSRVTIAAYLDRFTDFPVLQRGTNGREWQFDPVAVRAFLADKEAENDRIDAERQAAIGQLGLPIEATNNAASDVMSPRDRLDHVKAITAEDRLRVERGFLVSVPAERQVLNSAIARWNRSVHAAVRQASRDFNLPDAVTRALTERIAETQRALVRDLQIEAGAADADHAIA